MKKFFSCIIGLLFLCGTALAYTPNSSTINFVDTVSTKVEKIISIRGEEYRPLLIQKLGELREEYSYNDKIVYIISEVIKNIEISGGSETLFFSQTPEKQTFDRHAVFVINGDQQNIECNLNNKGFESCDSDLFFTDLPEGENMLSVKVIGSSSADAIVYSRNINDIFSSGTPDLIAGNQIPSLAGPRSRRGILRINCDFSHSSYNDPIVYPGLENMAHLHRFYGSMDVDHTTTTESLLTDGKSTCQGNELNRSAYWVPALLAPDYDKRSGKRLLDENGDPQWRVVPAVVGANEVAHEVFYYSAGIDDLDAIQPIPAGLRMIAGDHSTVPGDEQDSSIVRRHCQSWESDDANNPRFSSTIPECKAPDRVRMDIFFPSCWNGVDLDSEDHKSHMAYPSKNSQTGKVDCPDSHPVPLVRPSYHYAFGVLPTVYDPQTKSSKGRRIASDNYTVTDTQQGGLSLHADWFNGWHPTIMEAILETCIQDGFDCHNGNLANGWRLSESQEGSQVEPKIYNKGLGFGMDSH